jgi:ParB-like chromosome segregation protein Spo0J
VAFAQFTPSKLDSGIARILATLMRWARSLSELGLLQPIVITSDGQLIDGRRRLEAVKRLGWPDVRVTVVDIDGIVRGEYAANAYRKDFTPSEQVAITEAVTQRERELARQRMTLGKVSTGSAEPIPGWTVWGLEARQEAA